MSVYPDRRCCPSPTTFFDVDGEVDAGQRLVEIVDVEQDVVFRRVEGAEVEQMTIAAGLNRRAHDRLTREIVRHHRSCAAQKGERVVRHPAVPLGQKLRQPMLVALREQGDGVSFERSMQIGVEFTRRARPKPFAQFESLCAVQEPSGHRAKPQCVSETPPATAAITATATVPRSATALATDAPAVSATATPLPASPMADGPSFPFRQPASVAPATLKTIGAAAQRDDHCLTATQKIKGGAARKVAEKLIAAGLVREIKARIGTPVWRRDDETAQSFALKLTAAGLKAIAVDDGAIEEEPSEPAHASSEAQREVAPAGALADQGVITRNLNVGGGPGSHSQRLRESEAPSAPRSGSKAAEIVDLLQRDQGATIDELIEATGWLPHTTRAALTGLRKRGYEITRSCADGVTRYRIESIGRASNGPNSDAKDGRASPPIRDEKAA